VIKHVIEIDNRDRAASGDIVEFPGEEGLKELDSAKEKKRRATPGGGNRSDADWPSRVGLFAAGAMEGKRSP